MAYHPAQSASTTPATKKISQMERRYEDFMEGFLLPLLLFTNIVYMTFTRVRFFTLWASDRTCARVINQITNISLHYITLSWFSDWCNRVSKKQLCYCLLCKSRQNLNAFHHIVFQIVNNVAFWSNIVALFLTEIAW